MFRKLLHSFPVNISCAVPAFGINGPHFFEEGNCRVPVNSAWQWAMLKTELDTDNFDGELWFQQVSTNEHTANVWDACFLHALCHASVTLPCQPVPLTSLQPTTFFKALGSQSLCKQTGTLDEVEGHISVEVRAIEKRQPWTTMVIFNHDCKNVFCARKNPSRM